MFQFVLNIASGVTFPPCARTRSPGHRGVSGLYPPSLAVLCPPLPFNDPGLTSNRIPSPPRADIDLNTAYVLYNNSQMF